MDLIVIAKKVKYYQISLYHVDNPKSQVHPQLICAFADVLDTKSDWGVACTEVVLKLLERCINKLPIRIA